ncbi:hypothetical protein Tco_0188506 [Tanacetum coccineum]
MTELKRTPGGGQRGGEVVTVEEVAGVDVVAATARWWRREGDDEGDVGMVDKDGDSEGGKEIKVVASVVMMLKVVVVTQRGVAARWEERGRWRRGGFWWRRGWFRCGCGGGRMLAGKKEAPKNIERMREARV